MSQEERRLDLGRQLYFGMADAKASKLLLTNKADPNARTQVMRVWSRWEEGHGQSDQIARTFCPEHK
jgi:hypothetical protein